MAQNHGLLFFYVSVWDKVHHWFVLEHFHSVLSEQLADAFKIKRGLGAVCCLSKDFINIEFSLM